MADKPNMLNDLVKGALTTAISILVTYFVTSAIKKDEYQQTDSDKEKQRMESLEKTSTLLSSYISRYDSLHTRYITLLDKGRSPLVNSQGDEIITANVSSNQLNKVSMLMVSGNWITPDGIVGWRFEGNRVVVSGISSYAGFIEGVGSYQASGGNVSGTIHVSKAFYLPVNETMGFNFSISSDSQILYGTSRDAAGNVNALTLYKN
jgi:hypothetical protein